MKLRIGARGSLLAVTQAEGVATALKKNSPELDVTIQRIATTGDKNDGAPFSAIGGKGIFVKEIEDALLRNEIDLAIHSMKDLPQELPAGLCLGPTPLREDCRDAFISRFGELLNELPAGSTIGTSAPRRLAQIRHRYSKRRYRFEALRGNVDTRLRKLREGQVDAVVLAVAGLKRIGLESEITQILEPEEILPAPCQGCLALEVREHDTELLALLEKIKHEPSDLAARAERAFLQGLGGDCNVPVGAYSWFSDDELCMRALILDPEGNQAIKAEQSGPVSQPELVGAKLAGRLLYEGGSELLSSTETKR